MREERQKREEEEREAQRRREEEQRRREEEEARRRLEEEEARRRAQEEEARRRAEEQEAARKAQAEAEAALKKMEEEEERPAREPQTREDPDIELVTEEMLDQRHEKGFIQEFEDGEVTSSQDEELEQREEDCDLEINGTVAEAGPQLQDREHGADLKKETLEQTDPSTALKPTPQREDKHKQAPTDSASPASTVDKKKAGPRDSNRGQPTRSQEKREQRRRRGLEHNRRESERAAASSSPATSKDQPSPLKTKSLETSKLKERADSKELDQYTFVAWKVKEDKGGKKEEKTSPPRAAPVRPSTLSLQLVDPDKNGVGEGAGAVTLQRRSGAIKEKPERWKGRKSDGENYETVTLPSGRNNAWKKQL